MPGTDHRLLTSCSPQTRRATPAASPRPHPCPRSCSEAAHASPREPPSPVASAAFVFARCWPPSLPPSSFALTLTFCLSPVIPGSSAGAPDSARRPRCAMRSEGSEPETPPPRPCPAHSASGPLARAPLTRPLLPIFLPPRDRGARHLSPPTSLPGLRRLPVAFTGPVAVCLTVNAALLTDAPAYRAR